MSRYVPFPGSYMLMSIVGFFISLMVVYNRWPSWGVAFMIAFLIMFVSAVISMTRSEVEDREELYLHKKHMLMEKQIRESRKKALHK